MFPTDLQLHKAFQEARDLFLKFTHFAIVIKGFFFPSNLKNLTKCTGKHEGSRTTLYSFPYRQLQSKLYYTTSLGMHFKMYHGALQICDSKSGLTKGVELAINH